MAVDETPDHAGLIGRVMIAAVRGYQLLLSPLLPANVCRFHPSCSHYAIDAVRKRGPFTGGALAAWRILRCNPWGGSGHDPVPAATRRTPPDPEAKA